MTPEVERLLNRLRELGAKIDIDPDADGPQPAPFSFKLGLDYRKKILYFSGECDEDSVGHIIHEAGHLLACRKTPHKSDEYNFLGWEMALAIELDLLGDWLHGQMNYGVINNDNEGTDLGLLSDEELSELIEERIDYARSKGLVVGDRPVAIR
jgi:hypothetical protein